MRRAWMVAGVGLGFALACLLVACAIITGSTSGYVLLDSGVAPGPSCSNASGDAGDGGDAASGPASCLQIGCASSADCNGSGGDAGAMACCATLLFSPPGAVLACQAAPCPGGPSFQVCQGVGSADCGDGGACAQRSCTVNGGAVQFLTCGALPCK